VELGQTIAPHESKIANLERQGKTVVLVGSKSKIYGLIAVADIMRENSREAIRALRASGIQSIAMLTGDNKLVANFITEKLELDMCYSELLPEDKVTALKTIALQYGRVAMVGDGVNDAPALATADLGIAMGASSSDTALETAEIALMSDDLSKLDYIIKLSKKTVGIIKQNITFAIMIKILFVLGTFVGFVNLWLAVFADMGASLLVTLNGMRLMKEIR
jgi:Cd2+/Zn2+-exporting ATPase